MQEIYQKFIEGLGPWFYNHGLKIIVILIGAYIIRRFAGVVIDKIIRKAVVSDNLLTPEAEKKREDTLITVFSGTFRVIVWIAAALMIVAEFGINIGPLLAGAGIVGLAIGFGAQYIIRDFFTGLFIILEDQYRVGDNICVKDKCGIVEDINLRLTIIRDPDGAVHYIPNSEIKVVTNRSKGSVQIR